MKKITALFFILMLTASLSAQNRHRRGRNFKGGPGHFWLSNHMMEQAGIPEKKQLEVREKIHDTKKKLMDIGFEIRNIRKQSQNEFLKEKPDLKKLRKLNAKAAELKKKQILLMGKAKIDIISGFTSEQRKNILKLVEERRENFMKKMRGNPRKRKGGRR